MPEVGPQQPNLGKNPSEFDWHPSCLHFNLLTIFIALSVDQTDAYGRIISLLLLLAASIWGSFHTYMPSSCSILAIELAVAIEYLKEERCGAFLLCYFGGLSNSFLLRPVLRDAS